MSRLAAPRRSAGSLAALAPLSLAAPRRRCPRCRDRPRAQGFETTVVDARDAFRRHDRVRLAALKAQAAAERNPLAMWVDYWELTNRINEVQPAEFAAFAQRWRGTYVEDRLRNDWLLELVRRRDRATFAAEYPRFRMNDDREVTCFALANDQLVGQGRSRGRASPPGWRRRTPTTAAPSSPRRSPTRSSSRPADIWKKVRAQHRGQQAARRAPGRRPDLRRRRPRRWPRSSTARRATSPRRPAPRPAPTPS